MTCKEAAILLSQDVDGELSAVNRTVLKAHLTICDTCRQIQLQFQLLEQALDKRKQIESSGLPDDVKARLKKALQHEMDEEDPGK